MGWVTMDDGWQTNLGDWKPNPQKFPRGDASIRELVDKIHAKGLKAQLWWAPLSVSPRSDIAREHSDWLLLDAAERTGRELRCAEEPERLAFGSTGAHVRGRVGARDQTTGGDVKCSS